MAEHDEIKFEQELREKFGKLDSEIKVPEIPDVQNIFDKAEEEKTNVIPFKKYSRYVAAAAAVVLICVGIPVVKAFSEVSLDAAPESANLLSDIFDANRKSYDSVKSEESEIVNQSETREEPEVEVEYGESSIASSSVAGNGILEEGSVKTILANYFTENREKGKKPETSTTHRPVDGTDDVKTIKKEIDENRSILVTLENEKISVKLFDVFGKDEAAEDAALEEEIISEFWVEGIFEGSYLSGGYYIINLVKPVAPEELEEENYLPKFGTGEEENTIPEESVFISEEVTEGIISLIVEINVATGEYKIYASLV